MRHSALVSAVRRYGHRVLVLGVLASLAACGFHLQGAGSLPTGMDKTFVATRQAHSDFTLALTDTLRQRGADVLRAPDAAAAVLDIAADDTGQRVLSVSARNIPREYEVFYSVTFSLKLAGQSVISNETLVVTRSYTFDETQVLAKSAEEEVLRRALAEDLARRVIRRIESLGAAPAIAPKT
ncbi:MAG TPA: LPS assembly lipoprotein LptE [Gammaproteobacteria bacterium]|jgi:LPS-assembly lipoprotein|nr:LPS assembly lipoprotein LptE [Gammaproteobacteria bacterium]